VSRIAGGLDFLWQGKKEEEFNDLLMGDHNENAVVPTADGWDSSLWSNLTKGIELRFEPY